MPEIQEVNLNLKSVNSELSTALVDTLLKLEISSAEIIEIFLFIFSQIINLTIQGADLEQ